MVGANAHRSAVFLTDLHERNEPITNALKFQCVVSIRILNHGKLLFINVVAGIDADLLNETGGNLRSIRCVVDVGHQRCCVTTFTKPCPNMLKVLRLAHTRSGNANKLTTSFDHTDRLLNGRLRIHRVGGGH